MDEIKTEEVKITVEDITMVETMQIMTMVVEILYLITTTLAAVLEGVEHFSYTITARGAPKSALYASCSKSLKTLYYGMYRIRLLCGY